MKSKILHYVDFERANTLLEGFNKATGFVTGILDLDGNILSKSGWRQICTDFHRANPNTAQNCVASDTQLANLVTSGEAYHFYQCKNGLIDVAVPIVIKGEHVANLFSGQFFFEPPDVDFFKKQAQLYGFDEASYLDALNEVPVVSKEKVEEAMSFLLGITQTIIELTAEKLEQAELIETIRMSTTALRESEERFQLLFDRAPLGYQSLDSEGNFLEVNQKWLELFGYQKEEVIGKWFGDFLAPEYQEAFRKRFPLFKAQGYIHSEFEMVGKTGEKMFIAFDGKIGYAMDGAFQQTHCILKDITVEKELTRELEESKELMQATLISVGDGVISSDINGLVQFMNPVAQRLTGWTEEEAKGQRIEDVFHIINELTGVVSESITKLVLETGNVVGLANHTALVSKSGERRPIQDCAAPIILENGEVRGVVVVFSDFSEKRRRMEEIEYLSYHDVLTGLYNRRFFEEELKRYDVPRNLPISIVMGDVNGLKLINDSFGHAAGDELLQKAGEHIMRACRTDDIVARLGGDEFVVLLPRSNEMDAERLIQRIQDGIVDEKVDEIPLSVSFGFATKTLEDESMADVLKGSEDHMYRHKLYESTGARSKTVNLIINTLYAKNHREMLHSQRVSELAAAVATSMGFSPDDINQIKTAGLLHDIGKIGVEDQILNKKGRLTNKEWEEIRKHSEIGYRILSSVPEFSELANFVLEHQERWDGKGYPRGLKGEEISTEARIIAIADSFDAMTGERTYGRAFTKLEATEELLRCAGSQFDSYIVTVFIDHILEKND
jgi:diguanylate cyclase